MPEIDWNHFSQVDMRVGTILSAEDFPEAKQPAYKLTIDFGLDLGVKKTSAQITKNYNLSELSGMQVIAVVNFPPKQIATMMSECLVLGAIEGEDSVTLLQPRSKVKNGSRIS